MSDSKNDRTRSIELGDEPQEGALIAGKSWFFGIGINKYKEFPDLQNAVKDVVDIKNLLVEEYGLPKENVQLLFDEEATEENIIHRLDKLMEAVGPNDKLLIYYSGHGHLNKTSGTGFWIPSDAKKDKTSRYIRNSTIRDYINSINSRHTLLISDSCFSGSLFASGANRSSSLAMTELEERPSRWAICSGRHDEEVYDGQPGANSPFAESILDALRYNKRAHFNVAKLADQVIEQTRANYEQLPEGNPLYGVGHKGGQYVFHKEGAPVLPEVGKEKGRSLPRKEPSVTTASSTINWKKYMKFAPLLLLIPLVFWIFSRERPKAENRPSTEKRDFEGQYDDEIIDKSLLWMEPEIGATSSINFEGVEYPTVEIDNLVWFGKNLELPTSKYPSWPFKDYGRFYTWFAAQEDCVRLGEGWRLPTSGEWTALMLKFGGLSILNLDESYSVHGEPATAAAALSGLLDPKGGILPYPNEKPNQQAEGVSDEELLANYWSGSTKEEGVAYSFTIMEDQIYRAGILKTSGAYCRCVRER